MRTAVHNIADYSCPVTTNLREALERINRTSGLFQVATDANGAVVGTVTDGDIRRALLDGRTLDDSVAHCMFMNFRYARAGHPADIDRLFADREKPVSFIPVLDEERRLVSIETIQRLATAGGPQRAVVMAGGYGKRLGDLTKSVPKPLLKIGGKPILERVLNALEDCGVREIFISIHYLGEQIEQFVKDRKNSAHIEFIRENEPMGTAGALSQLPTEGSHPALVVNGDVLTEIDFRALHVFHNRHDLDGTIAVSPYEIKVPFGVVRVNDEGLFSGIEEKPVLTEFVSAGIYYLTPQVLALAPRNRRIDMPELLNKTEEVGLRLGLFPIHEYWIDVGQKHDLQRAHDDHDTEK